METSVNELYEILRAASYASSSLPPEYGPAKPGEQPRSSIDATIAGRDVGWRPKTDLATGLAETLDFFGALKS